MKYSYLTILGFAGVLCHDVGNSIINYGYKSIGSFKNLNELANKTFISSRDDYSSLPKLHSL